MKPAQQLTARILQRWPVVVALAVIGGIVAAAWSITSAATVWTATTALTTQSQNRSPDQDAVLALGYVDYFNQDSYQQLLRAEAAIPDTVELSARTGATSPVFYVEASGPAEDQVRTAAAAAAAGYREDVRKSLVVERQQAAADLQAQIDASVVTLQVPTRTEAERNVIGDQIRSLQGRLTDLQADNTNLIKQLQPEPGVASATPSPAADIAAGVVGGAVLGVLIAILLGSLDTRLRGRRDVAQRLGLATLADFDHRADGSVRGRKLANLANSLQLGTDPSAHRIVAVVGARRTGRSSALAKELAGLLAARRTRAVLMMTDLDVRQDRAVAGRSGLVEVLAGQLRLRGGLLRHPAGYDVLPAGQPPVGDSFAAFRPERLTAVTSELSASYDVVVIDVPPVLEASESQLICAAADCVIVAVDRGRTRVREVREALALLADVHAPVSGVVIDSRGVEEARSTFGPMGTVPDRMPDALPEPRHNGGTPRRDVVPVEGGNGSGSTVGGASRPSPRPRMSSHPSVSHPTVSELLDRGSS